MKTAIDKDHPWVYASLEVKIVEINAEYFTPEIFDAWGKPLRPMTDEECEAEFERRAGRTFFRVLVKHGNKVQHLEGPMTLPQHREEALVKTFAMLAQSFFNHFHKEKQASQAEPSAE